MYNNTISEPVRKSRRLHPLYICIRFIRNQRFQQWLGTMKNTRGIPYHESPTKFPVIDQWKSPTQLHIKKGNEIQHGLATAATSWTPGNNMLLIMARNWTLPASFIPKSIYKISIIKRNAQTCTSNFLIREWSYESYYLTQIYKIRLPWDTQSK